MPRWKIAGINFDHFHMLDLLSGAAEHPEAAIVSICDQQPARMQEAIEKLGLKGDQVFTDYRRCLEKSQPDIVVLCPAAAEHGQWVETVMEYPVHVIVEKPMAANVAEADRMIAAAERSGKQLLVNWPMAWFPTNRTAFDVIDSGQIGEVQEVHYYDGNRGPLYHTAGKRERTADEVAREKPTSWFYRRSAGGGSLLDYLGYGTTLATWFNGGRLPRDVMAMVDQPVGLEVDEHGIVVARYESGLSKFETRWGTFTDPWTHQPQPRCGFVIVGTDGTIGSFDYQPSIRVQSRDAPQGRDVPVRSLRREESEPVAYLIDCLEHDRPLAGPSSPSVSRIGQRIVDAAVQSIRQQRVVRLE